MCKGTHRPKVAKNAIPPLPNDLSHVYISSHAFCVWHCAGKCQSDECDCYCASCLGAILLGIFMSIALLIISKSSSKFPMEDYFLARNVLLG
jgi:hypothetical protein